MIEFKTEDRERVMILIPNIIAFEKLNEETTLIVLNHGVEYVVKSTFSEIKNIMLDFYEVTESDARSEVTEDVEDLSYMSETYTEEEIATYSDK